MCVHVCACVCVPSLEPYRTNRRTSATPPYCDLLHIPGSEALSAGRHATAAATVTLSSTLTFTRTKEEGRSGWMADTAAQAAGLMCSSFYDKPASTGATRPLVAPRSGYSGDPEDPGGSAGSSKTDKTGRGLKSLVGTWTSQFLRALF